MIISKAKKEAIVEKNIEVIEDRVGASGTKIERNQDQQQIERIIVEDEEE